MIIQRAEAWAERELAHRKRAEAQRARDEVIVIEWMVMMMTLVITMSMEMTMMLTMMMIMKMTMKMLPGKEKAKGGGRNGQKS